MNRTLLNAQSGNVITFAERPGVRFEIKKEIGRGASCIVYHAVGSDQTEHLLKEYYPKHLDLSRDSSGQIVVPEDKTDIYEQGLLRFRGGCERQKSIRLSNEGLKNFTCNVQGYYQSNGTEYIDMTCFNGHTYDHVQEKSAYELMLRMKTLAQVVGNYHKAGLLHLDIKPENIYVRPEGETIEDVMLFDFDSVTPMDRLCTTKVLSCTKAWAAPEQLLPEKRRSICPATDLFAIGEIVFVQLFGRHSTSAERRSFVTKYDYNHEAPIFKDMNPKVFPLLDDLLCHTICGVVGKRYQSADKLAAKLDEIFKTAAPNAPYLKSSLPEVQDFFVGRENEINEIYRLLNENNILFLNGIGGIGKSELAKHYAVKHKDDYDAIIFAPYVSDINMLLQDDNAIPLYNFSSYPEENPEEYCTRKLKKLRELCDERTLFIVDNLDREDDPDLNKLLDLGCKLLITTRMDFSDYGYGQQLYLDALYSRDSIREIFRKYYTKPLPEEENACVEQIIDLVAGHTMTVELLAKQMMAGRVKPEKMLAKLQDGGISDSGKEKVRSGKDGVLSAQSTYAHIQTLFDLSELNDDEKYILANLSLIPYAGISTELFHDWCELEDYDGINALTAGGWVRVDVEYDYISVHPVVAEVVYRTLTKPKTMWKKCLKNARIFADKEFPRLSPIEKYRSAMILQNMLSIVYKKNVSSKKIAFFFRVVADIVIKYGSFKECEKYLKRSLDIRLELLGEDDWDSIISYTSLADYYRNVGKYENAMHYYNIILLIKERMYGCNSFTYGKTMEEIGVLYCFMQEYQLSEEVLLKAKQIYVAEKGVESFAVTRVNLQLAELYGAMGNNKEAESLLLDNIRRREAEGRNTHLVHHALGTYYRDIGEYDKAIYHAKKCLEKELEMYIEDHTSVATSYSSLGMAYFLAGDLKNAEVTLTRALEIRKRIVGEEHWRTAVSYYRMGLLYENVQEYQPAKFNYQKAFEIRARLFGETHADTIDAKSKVDAMIELSRRERCNL